MKLTSVLIGLNGIIWTSLSAGYILQNRINDSIPPYIESNLERIMERQEDRLGIKHFGAPKIVYKKPRWQKSPVTMNISGIYYPKEDEIYFPLGSAITPEKNLINNIVTTIAPGLTHNIKQTLDHELGHFYTDKLSESLGRGDWPIFSDKQSLGDKIGLKMTSEGIAEYFERSASGQSGNFYNYNWPKKTEDLVSTDRLYDGGFHLVKPIIDIYGKQGMKYLIINPPKGADLRD
ncbi:MAG: hypothetical protein OEL87_03125, partial [Nanoarchaeota archaeon]|nr:hypothetical protein [Nanoarchaeota archaeon]